MDLPKRNDPFSNPTPDEPKDGDDDNGSMVILARILAFLFAAVLSWILYRVLRGAYGQYKRNGAASLLDRRRGYRRVPSLRLHRPPEEQHLDTGYRDDVFEDEEDEDVDNVLRSAGTGALRANAPAEIGGRGKKAARVEVVDEGYHDSETSLDMGRSTGSASGSVNGDVNVWKELPAKPLPDKPLPDVPRG